VISFADGGLVAGRWSNFENLACLAVAGSSNDLAREVIELYFDEDQTLPMTVILAESQPSARGRRGQWVAPAGRGLYLTFVRPVEPGEPLTLIPLAVARWVRDAVEDSTGVAARVKWPNDLYVEKRKLAGVLSESRTQGEDTYVAIGIGLNVLGRAQELPVPGATTLEEEADRPISLSAVAQGVLDRLDRELSDPKWKEEPSRWEKVAVHRAGDSVTVRRGGNEITGQYLGVTHEGFLRISTKSGEETVSSGEMTRW
jgi:BirA family biotin operon repressor/biotin-[acetyl-CoA-carboxylase] ligase